MDFTRRSPRHSLLSLTLLASALVGCDDNRTLVERDAYVAAQPQALECLPNLDGQLSADELVVALDLPANYLVSPAGAQRAVDLVGAVESDGTLLWDWSVDEADDQQLEVRAASIADRWYASSFPPDAFVTPFDASGSIESVSRRDGQALWLLGLASAEQDPPEGRTLMTYREPVALLRFPLTTGQSYEAVGVVENATLRGLPYAGSDRYEVSIDALGQLELPQLIFTQAHRVRTHVTLEPAVGNPTSQRQVSYFFECFGEVARAVSLPDEPNADFTTASEMWRLGLL
jgi:hypothetical protein